MARVAALAAIALVLAGCGGKPGMVTPTANANGRFGFGAEGAQQPALLHRADGSWVLAYVGTKLGGAHVYLSRSTDGKAWSAPKRVDDAEMSDQHPALVEDATGHAHLYFASNRDGEDFELYHLDLDGGATEQVPGFTGIQDLAAAYAGDKLVLASEIMGEGLFVGDATAKGAKLTDMGFEPAMTAMPDGRVAIAYTRDGAIFGRAGKPGVFTEEASLAKGADRLREPALSWLGDRGHLVYAERAGTTYGPKACSFGTDLRCENANALSASGDVRGSAIAADGKGKTLVAWGIKNDNGQQGVVVGPGE